MRAYPALARRAQTGELKPDEYFEKSADLVEESARAADGAVDQLAATSGRPRG